MVEAINEKGCKAQDEVCIDITNDYSVFVPNSFTPNDDGINDVFYVYGFGIKECKLSVYDKWGELLFSSESQSKGWDGTYKGEICKLDTYVYHLEYTPYRGTQGSKTGHVNIIR